MLAVLALNVSAQEKSKSIKVKKPKTMKTASGLEYTITSKGNGKKPQNGDKVKVHYTGKLTNDTVFDSSVKRGQPATFPLNMVIKGWTEGLQLMSVGSKWRFFIPPNLGYGERQMSAQIAPNSTLIFEVELLGVS